MKSSFTTLVAVLGLASFGISAASADVVVRRLDHSNGGPTFIYTPDNDANPLPTVAVYTDRRGMGYDNGVVLSEDSTVHKVKIRHGRGQNITGPVESR